MIQLSLNSVRFRKCVGRVERRQEGGVPDEGGEEWVTDIHGGRQGARGEALVPDPILAPGLLRFALPKLVEHIQADLLWLLLDKDKAKG